MGLIRSSSAQNGPNPIFFYPIWAQSDLLLIEARPDFTSLGSVLRDIDDFDSPCPNKKTEAKPQ